MNMNIRRFTTLALICAVLGLAACNTIEGMGKDIGKAGSVIEDTAKKAK
jgi:predicted small secreted protein